MRRNPIPMNSKHELRKKMKAMRRALRRADVVRWSGEICCRLSGLDVFRHCQQVFVYVSIDNEVRTHDLIQQLLDDGKTVAVPRIVDDRRIEPVRISNWDELAPDDWGILTSTHGRRYEGSLDICITPGLAFTVDGHRLGYGRGYYDRFLNDRQSLVTIGLALECQIAGQIPTTQHDQPVDIIVTQDRTIVVR